MGIRLDTSGDGLISWGEFQPMLERDDMQLMMSTLDVDTGDLETLWGLLDDGDGEISAEEFTKGAMRMKGPAKGIDVVALLSNVHRLEKKIDEQNQMQMEATSSWASIDFVYAV